MNDLDKYLLESIKLFVWTGFNTLDDVHTSLDTILEEGADEVMLRSAIQSEFEKKRKAEMSWPKTTDCDRLDIAFDNLRQRGMITLHNPGYTMDDGLDEVDEVLQATGKKGTKGYCFYHGQDVERALNNMGLMIAFGDLQNEDEGKMEVGNLVQQELQSAELQVEWNGESSTRINIPEIKWLRRSPV